ncbi:MAG: hypothetical protein ABSF77_17845 [Spirochaetia bacterium]|jgi:hypothetical protein
MDSGLYLHVFFSWEVIATSLILMLLLPLVFFVASTRSRNRRPAAVRMKLAPAARPSRAKKPVAEAAKAGEPSDARPRSRAIELPDDTEEKA